MCNGGGTLYQTITQRSHATSAKHISDGCIAVHIVQATTSVVVHCVGQGGGL